MAYRGRYWGRYWGHRYFATEAGGAPSTPFGIFVDPEMAVVVQSMDSPFDVDPEMAVIVQSMDSPFDVDPEQAVLIR